MKGESLIFGRTPLRPPCRSAQDQRNRAGRHKRRQDPEQEHALC